MLVGRVAVAVAFIPVVVVMARRVAVAMAVAMVACARSPEGRNHQRRAHHQQEYSAEGAEPGIDALGRHRRDREQGSQTKDTVAACLAVPLAETR